MSGAYAVNGNRCAAEQTLVVVRVEDAIDPRLTGRAGVVYESPPQSRGQAIALVQLLLGHGGEPTGNDAGCWVAAVAGGRRIVTLSPAA